MYLMYIDGRSEALLTSTRRGMMLKAVLKKRLDLIEIGSSARSNAESLEWKGSCSKALQVMKREEKGLHVLLGLG